MLASITVPPTRLPQAQPISVKYVPKEHLARSQGQFKLGGSIMTVPERERAALEAPR